MENQLLQHHDHMTKHLIFLTTVFIYNSSIGQCLNIGGYGFVHKEVKYCNDTHDEKGCYDYLINLYDSTLKLHYAGINSSALNEEVSKFNYMPGNHDHAPTSLSTFYKKLILFNIKTGGLAFEKGQNFMSYFKHTNIYIDSLAQIKPKDDDLVNFKHLTYLCARNCCYYTYHKDTALFFKLECDSLFREFDPIDSSSTVATSEATVKVDHHPAPKIPYGQFNINDTLRINRSFVSNEKGIEYLKHNQSYLLEQIRYKTIGSQFTPLSYEETDTIIVLLEVNFNENSIQRKVSMVYSSAPELASSFLLTKLNEIPLKYSQEIKLYLPFVIRPEQKKAMNHFNRVTIGKDHFLIEYEVLRPIESK